MRDVSDDRSSKWYSFLAKSTTWSNGFLSKPVLKKLLENRRWISLMLEKIVVDGSALKKTQKLESKSLQNALNLIVNSETNLEMDAGWQEFNLQHFACSDRIRKLCCYVEDILGLTGLISCCAMKDLCLNSLAEPSG